MAKPATEIKDIIEGASRLHYAQFGCSLNKQETFIYKPKNTSIIVTLRGHTNLSGPWAVYEGPLGCYQAILGPTGLVKGQPQPISTLKPYGAA